MSSIPTLTIDHKRNPHSKSRVLRALVIIFISTTLALTLAVCKNKLGPIMVLRALITNSASKRDNKRVAAEQVNGSTLWQRASYLTAADGEPDDEMGNAVGISGNTAIVGAQFQTVSGKHLLGAAYIFLRSTTNTWSLQQEIPNPGTNLNFGFSVAISGETAVVGSPAQGDSTGMATGKVYIYVRSEGAWLMQQVLDSSVQATGATHFLGQTVAISGDTLAVGDPFTGIYVFQRTGATWSLQQKLIANGVQGAFPASLAIDRGTIIASAPFPQVAYVFVRNGSSWSQQQVLSPNDGGPSDSFGNSVAISGDTVVIGSYLADINGQVDQGAAYVFDRVGSTWTQRQKLVASDGKADRLFGDSVCISNSMIVIGAGKDRVNGPDDPKGAAYVFTRDFSNQWTERQKLTGNSDTLWFGQAAAIDGASLVVGAPFDRNGTTPPTLPPGAAYTFQMPDTDGDGLPDDWEQNGVSINGIFIDLPAMGANPLHKDIFVHADWMQPDPSRPGFVFKPSPRAIKIVTDAFLRAPVDNPDSKKGINLHVDLGPDSVMNPLTGAKWGILSRANAIPFQANLGTFTEDSCAGKVYDWGQFDQIKANDFTPVMRSAVFHYALFANQYAQTGSSGISRGIRAADLLVTLGTFSKPGGTVMQQAGTFMHELGHNLNLHHGGGDDVNRKPNYLSIMNYNFQMVGLVSPSRKRSFDYSRSTLSTLDETNLDENAGISDSAGHLTLWNKLTSPTSPAGTNKCVINPDFYNQLFLPSKALDWNCDGVRTSTPVQADINGDGYCVDAGKDNKVDSILIGDDTIRSNPSGHLYVVAGQNRTCETPALGDDKQLACSGFVEDNPLIGFNDWPALAFDGNGAIGSGDVNRAQLPNTLNIEPSQEDLFRDVPTELIDAEQNAPVENVTVTPDHGPASLMVTFDGTTSQAVNGTITDWAWDFGDGTTGSGPVVTHTYNTPGDYFATLNITDSNGNVNLVPLIYNVSVTDPNATPTPTPTPSSTPTPTPSPSAIPTPTPGPGDVDATFAASVTQNISSVKAILVQPDGKVLVGGAFESFGGAPMRAVARVKLDGRPDPTFRPGLSVPFERALSYPVSLSLQPDGKILIGMHYEGTSGLPQDSPLVLRLNTDGSLDTAFHMSFSRQQTTAAINAIAVAPNGKILIGGNFAYQNGLRRNVVRLNNDGTFDQAFVLSSGNPVPQPVSSLVLQTDGKILIGGSFTKSVTSLPRTALARLNADGSLDSTFDTGMSGPITVSRANCIALQPDGKILAGGVFDFDDTNQHNEIIARFNTDGTRDQTFTDIFPTIVGGNSIDITTMALQPDGKVVIGGHFTTAAGSNQLARLNSDGTLDASFNLGSNFTTQGVFGAASVNTVAVRTSGQQAGSVIVGGEFIVFSGTAVEGIIQLNSNAGLDSTFISKGPGFNANVLALTEQVDHRLLVGFTPSISGINITRLNESQRQGIGRLNPDGTTDLTFTSPFARTANTNAVKAMAVQSDGKILVSGSLQLPGVDSVATLVRLNIDGSLDSSFVPFDSAGGGPIAIQPDGKIVTNGFTSGPGLVRLNTNGSLDSSFKVILNRDGQANALVVQPDGRILLGGTFTTVCDNLSCVPRNNVARVNPDGSPDGSFDPGTGADNVVLTLALQPDGKPLIGGSFLNLNGTARPGIARLNTDGKLDMSFTPVNQNTDQFGSAAPVLAMALQNDGRIVFGTRSTSASGASPNRVQRLNSDGTLDQEFNHGGGTNGNVNALIARSDGMIAIGGNFSVVNNSSCLALAQLLPSTGLPTPTPTPTPTASPTPTPNASTVQFSATSYQVGEGDGGVVITVTRRGDITTASTIDYRTLDTDTFTVGCADAINNLGGAFGRCDFATAVGTLSFAAGENIRMFTIPIIDDAYVEGAESFQIQLSNPTNTSVGTPATTTVSIVDNDQPGESNPIFTTPFFVRLQYLDFLSREPEQGEPWSAVLNRCPDVNNLDPNAPSAACDRIIVSASFFGSPEFQLKGFYVFRFYKLAFNRLPEYTEIVPDMSSVAGSTPEEVYARKAQFTVNFTGRTEFTNAYGNLSNTQYVNSLLGRYSLGQITTLDPANPDGTSRVILSASDLINCLDGNTLTRAQVLRAIADSDQCNTAEFNNAFVAMQYYGYLRRKPEPAGYQAWLKVVQSGDTRTMVNGFMNSAEYRLRFGQQ